MIFTIIGIIAFIVTLVGAGIVLWDKIVYIKKPIKKVYGEITYDNPSKIILYDFSRYEKESVVGMIYHSDVKSMEMYNEIFDGVYQNVAKELPDAPRDIILEAVSNKMKLPHFYTMDNAMLLINRFNGNKLIEGEIKQWTQ